MIYRLSRANNISSKINYIDEKWPSKPNGFRHATTYGDYGSEHEELFIGDMHEYCDFYRAPILPYWNRPSHIIVELLQKEMPDVYFHGEEIFVSSKARKIIESIDDFNHQYSPIIFENKIGKCLSQEDYFSINIRRKLDVAQLDFVQPKKSVGSYPLDRTLTSIATIQNSKSLSKLIEKIPLWMNVGLMSEFYINEELFLEFNKNGILDFDGEAITPILQTPNK